MLTDAEQLERRAAIVRILREGLVRKQADLVRLRRSRMLRLAAAREHASRRWPGGGPDLHDLTSMVR